MRGRARAHAASLSAPARAVIGAELVTIVETEHRLSAAWLLPMLGLGALGMVVLRDAMTRP